MKTHRIPQNVEMSAKDGQCKYSMVFSSSVQILLPLPLFNFVHKQYKRLKYTGFL